MYQYDELRSAALAPTATKEDRLALCGWFSKYDNGSWNGECFDLEDGHSLYPIMEEQEDGDWLLVDAEIR
jgi:hypothetical protein